MFICFDFIFGFVEGNFIINFFLVFFIGMQDNFLKNGNEKVVCVDVAFCIIDVDFDLEGLSDADEAERESDVDFGAAFSAAAVSDVAGFGNIIFVVEAIFFFSDDDGNGAF